MTLPRCPRCLDDGIVCEEHPWAPWDMTVEGHRADCGPPGIPCPACCSDIPEDGTTSITVAFTPDWRRQPAGTATPAVHRSGDLLDSGRQA